VVAGWRDDRVHAADLLPLRPYEVSGRD